jgi:hypothetical protein
MTTVGRAGNNTPPVIPPAGLRGSRLMPDDDGCTAGELCPGAVTLPGSD